MELTFTAIHAANSWKSKESVSGPGSTLGRTINVRKGIPSIIDAYQIKSFTDIPCGDLNWISKIVDELPNYTGIDIVKQLVDTNKEKFPNLNVRQGDIITDGNLQCDLLMCRHTLFHFSQADVQKAINNIKNNNVKYLLTTDFENSEHINKDINTGTWYRMSLQNSPYNFPKPLCKIPEWGAEQANTDWPDNQYLSLWLVEDLPYFDIPPQRNPCGLEKK